jgi:hypothetical protein
MNCQNCDKELFGVERESLQGEYTEYYHIEAKWPRSWYYHCHKKDVLPSTPAPKCHICKVLQPPHKPYCSAAGMPQYFPMPKSELQTGHKRAAKFEEEIQKSGARESES